MARTLPTLLHLSRRELRLGSGLVMFSYIVMHFSGHAAGLWSLAAAERVLALCVRLWHGLPGSVLLYGAVGVHLALALWAVYERRTLRMPPAQLLRIAMGFAIPVLLIGHVTATRVAAEVHGLAPTYTRIVWALWVSDGEGRQLAMQVPGWVHGCLGLQFAFGRRPLWQRLQPALLGAALLLPVVAGLGFLAMGRELAALATAGGWQGAAVAATPAQMAALGRLRDSVLAGYFVIVGAAFAARALRAWIERQRRTLVSIGFPQRVVQVPRGWTVLEASRAFGIAHLSMCGGQARCSTCRVRVVAGAAQLPEARPHERHTLQRIQAPDDVRLACQLRPTAAVQVEPLLDPHTAQVCDNEVGAGVAEREVALLFVKLVAWRSTTNQLRSPHDVVFALNRWLAVVGDAVTAAGGRHGRYDNEGAGATFEGSDRHAPVRQALEAARAVAAALDQLNAVHQGEVGLVADFVIAVHAGPAVLGPVGYGRDRTQQPVGETVRAARALRDAAAAQGLRFAVSRAAAERAGWATEALAWQGGEEGVPQGVLLESLPAGQGSVP